MAGFRLCLAERTLVFVGWCLCVPMIFGHGQGNQMDSAAAAEDSTGSTALALTTAAMTTENTTEPAIPTELEEEMTLEDPETGVVIVNVSQSYTGYGCPPLFAYRSTEYSYLVVTSCTGRHTVANESCADMQASLALLRDERVAAAAAFAAYMEQGVKVHSKSARSAKRKVGEFTFWTAPAIALPWDSLTGSPEDSMGKLKVTIYDSGEPHKYEWTTSVYADDNSKYFWLCEANSTAEMAIGPAADSNLYTSSTTSTITYSLTSLNYANSSSSPHKKSLPSTTQSTATESMSGTEITTVKPGDDIPTYARRKPQSIMDYRASAIFLGSGGIIILLTIVSAIVLMDLGRLYQAYKQTRVKVLKKKKKKKRSSVPSVVSSSPSVCTLTSEMTISDIETEISTPIVPPISTSLD